MYGYSCGCGSIGNAKEPYEYAYQLFTPEYKKNHSFDEFINSYSGTGHTTFLNLHDAYTPLDTPKNIKYYVFEYEIISGTKQSDSNKDSKTYCNFNYMYGIITTEYYNERGWKIKSIDTLQEDFLCAPYHKWSYLSNLVIQYVYIEGLGIIDQVTNKYISGNHIHIYATGNNQDYRIDFVRLTNGYDLLLHEYKWMNNHWVETDLLTPVWKTLKFSIESFET
jgi:hypothetical protein